MKAIRYTNFSGTTHAIGIKRTSYGYREGTAALLMFSIKPRWARLIASGEKTYELRRRPPPKEAVGQVALIYSTAPDSKVTCACNVVEIVAQSKEVLWDEIGSKTGCLRSEYLAYFDGLEVASAIRLSLMENIFPEMTRDELEKKYNFKPPQSWRWADSLNEAVVKL
ncbi:ASCH domain-containing protein [Ensifer aridi]|uniref:ASCH domain-containing protein n=1 Tax=Ensifer aridi TaxID=1708715 RepID=UPI0009BE79D9|nr:ASCH domain-containing protein [Ensifer aridi]